MERLSDFAADIINDLYENSDWYGDYSLIEAAINRLAAYEDTGLEPEEVKYAYQKGWKGALDEIAYEEQAGTILVDNHLLAKYIELGPVDRLRELAQAALRREQDG